MRRPLVYAAAGFVLGEVWLLAQTGLRAGLAALAAAGVLFAYASDRKKTENRKSGRSLPAGFVPLFCMALLGAARLAADRSAEPGRVEAAAETAGRTLRAEGRLDDIREGNGTTYQAVMELSGVTAHIRDPGKTVRYPGTILVYLDEAPDMEDLRIGTRVSVWGELERMPAASNPGEFDYREYCHALGIEGRMFGEDLEIVSREYSPWSDAVFRIRTAAARTLKEVCREEDRGMFQAIVLGDKTALPDDVRDLYRRNGIAHLLAVSGLHVSLIGMGFYRLLRRAGAGITASGSAAALLTVAYGFLTGGSASVVRAAFMVCLQLLAEKLGRTYDLLSAVSAAAVFLLLQSPTLLFQAGFQLSFGAVLSVGGILPVLAEWTGAEKGVRASLVGGVSIQISAFPMTVWHYFEYPVYGILLNLIVVPLMGYVLISGLGGIVLGRIWVPAGRFAVGTGHFILALYEAICRGAEKLPGAVQIIGRPSAPQLILYCGIWGAVLAFAAWSSFREAESGSDGKSRGRAVFAAAVILAGTASGYLALQPIRPSGFRATVLDVGQGDGICLESGETVILVDGGSSDRKELGSRILEPFLKSRGISRIDWAIVSHGDQDHISGLIDLLESDSGITVCRLVLPVCGKGDEKYSRLCRLAQEAGAQITWMEAGDALAAENPRLLVRCLYAGDAACAGDTNEHSLFLEASYGSCSLLLTGDMSGEGEKRWLERQEEEKTVRLAGQGGEAAGVRILKAAHHGSDYSSGAEFLDLVDPAFAVISCGENNRYGHPGKEMTGRLEERGIGFFVTADTGAVTIEGDGETVRIRGTKPGSGREAAEKP